MFCQKCGHEDQDNASFCPNCGFALKKAPTNGFKLPTLSLTKSQQISAIICSIWFIIWIFIRAIAFNRQYDTEEREICLLVAIFISHDKVNQGVIVLLATETFEVFRNIIEVCFQLFGIFW